MNLCMNTQWTKAKSAIEKRVAAHSYRMWIEPLGLKSWHNGSVVLLAPNFFSRKRVLEHYKDLLATVLSEAAGHPCQVSIEVGSTNASEARGKSTPQQLPLPEEGLRFHNGRLLRRDFTFDQFVVGGNNDFAYSAALSLANARQNDQSALYLISRPGMGKSHLSQAIGHHIISHSRSELVFYTTVEDFTQELVQAFQSDQVVRFKDKYRNGCDVLLLEDVHYLTGKERTQIELAQTLDSLQESGKKIIFSSCCLPNEIPRINDKLCSRLSNGLISRIEPPNFRTRARILKKKAASKGTHLPEAVVEYLAGELHEDVRQLESGLVGITAKSNLLGMPIDLDLAQAVVSTIVRARKAVTIEAIKKLVSRQYRVAVNDMVSPSRKKCHVRPRQVAIYLSRAYTDTPLEAIGRSFNRYHATAMHSIQCIERGIRTDHQLRRQVEMICERLDSGDF